MIYGTNFSQQPSLLYFLSQLIGRHYCHGIHGESQALHILHQMQIGNLNQIRVSVRCSILSLLAVTDNVHLDHRHKGFVIDAESIQTVLCPLNPEEKRCFIHSTPFVRKIVYILGVHLSVAECKGAAEVKQRAHSSSMPLFSVTENLPKAMTHGDTVQQSETVAASNDGEKSSSSFENVRLVVLFFFF